MLRAIVKVALEKPRPIEIARPHERENLGALANGFIEEMKGLDKLETLNLLESL